MSVELSHRLARVVHQSPITDLSLPERRALWLAAERAADFTELTGDHQALILAAESAWQRAVANTPRRSTA